MPRKRKRKTPKKPGGTGVEEEPKRKILKAEPATQQAHQEKDLEASPRDVKAIKKAIKAKQGWQTKILDDEIRGRYISESAAQGANRKSISVAINELLRESVISSVENTTVLPEEEEGKDFDFHDFGRGEDEEEDGEFGRHDVAYVDNLIPESRLRATLEAQLDVIANAPLKDFHPGTDGKIQDLFHPSMFPYIRNISYDRNAPPKLKKKRKKSKKGAKRTKKRKDAKTRKKKAKKTKKAKKEDDSDEEEEEEDDFANYEDEGLDPMREREFLEHIKKLEGWDSIYQWLPAEYRVNEDGEVSIESYINNLDRDTHPELYKTLAKVFRLFLPLFEKVLSDGQQSLNNRTLQVITKAANYILKPGEEYSGNWHVEGMKHEHVVASGIYYYSTTDNLPGSHLAFRELRTNDMNERERTRSLNFYHNLGKVDTPMSRCLVFGNTLQHKVRPMKNDSKKVGVRKILCFFLVDPAIRIKSSLDIPEQQWDRVKRKTALTMCGVLKRMNIEFPLELLKIILDFAQWGFTLDEALAHRLELMKERKYYVDHNNEIWERNFSFCEH